MMPVPGSKREKRIEIRAALRGVRVPVGVLLSAPEIRLAPGDRGQEMRNQPLHRIVCDYIAGMTGGFFLRCYQQGAFARSRAAPMRNRAY